MNGRFNKRPFSLRFVGLFRFLEIFVCKSVSVFIVPVFDLFGLIILPVGYACFRCLSFAVHGYFRDRRVVRGVERVFVDLFSGPVLKFEGMAATFHEFEVQVFIAPVYFKVVARFVDEFPRRPSAIIGFSVASGQ